MGRERDKSESKDIRDQQRKTEKHLWEGRTENLDLHDVGQPAPVVISNIYIENGEKFYNLLARLASTFHWPLFFLWILGILKYARKARFDKGQCFILSFYLLYLPILYLLLVNIGYVSRRHLVPLVMIGLFWVAIGVEELRDWLVGKIGKWNRASHFSPSRLFVLIVALTVAILLPKTLKPQRSDKAWIKEAGIWITKNGPLNPKIVSNDPRIAYYAGGESIVTLPGKAFQEIEGLAQKERVDFIVLESNQIQIECFDSPSGRSKTLNLVHQLPDMRGGKILIYQVLDTTEND